MASTLSASRVTLPPGAFQVVDTGDPVPEGCDGVVMIEDVVWEPGGTWKKPLVAARVVISPDLPRMGRASHSSPSRTRVAPLDVNSVLLGAVAEEAGADCRLYGIIPDREETKKRPKSQAVKKAATGLPGSPSTALPATSPRMVAGLITTLAATNGFFHVPRDCEGLPKGARTTWKAPGGRVTGVVSVAP